MPLSCILVSPLLSLPNLCRGQNRQEEARLNATQMPHVFRILCLLPRLPRFVSWSNISKCPVSPAFALETLDFDPDVGAVTELDLASQVLNLLGKILP